MRISLLTLISCCIFSFGYAQTQEFNFDFEIQKDQKPAAWNLGGKGNYSADIDTTKSKCGKNSAFIKSLDDNCDYYVWTKHIPVNFSGSKIKLTGYVKTEDISDGYAGLWMRIDPKVGFDNMSKRGIKGTSKWTKCEIELKLNSEKATDIYLGGLLVGNGTAWFDNLEVLVDGKPIENIKPVEPENTDTRFDDGSNISNIELNEQKAENLYLLGLTWGYLKYYHPVIATGKYNWDYELFAFMPEYLSAKNNSERDQLLIKWIDDLGNFETTEYELPDQEDIKYSPDLTWIEATKISEDLKSKLLKLQSAKREDSQYYIELQTGVKNPIFKNENEYANMDYADAGYRLLGLYRYWNIIHYFFPNKHLIEEDWKGVLKEFIPKFVNTKDESGYKLTCLELIARIHDTHANVWNAHEVISEYWGKNFTILRTTFIDEQAIVSGFRNDSIGKLTGLNIGDKITKVNGITVSDWILKHKKYVPASNYPTQLRNLNWRFLCSNEESINIEYENESGTHTTTVATYPDSVLRNWMSPAKTDTSYKMLSEDIAYINNGKLKKKHVAEFWKEFKNTKGLVIDIRNYPSDFPIYVLSGYLMKKSRSFVKFTHGSLETPGLVSFKKTRKAGKRNFKRYKGKVVILINESTQSSAEFHAMAYQTHPNAVTVGSTTAAADGNVSFFYLPGNIRTCFTGIGVYYPDRSETQRVGIKVDIEVKPTIDGIINEKDEVLDKAIEIINEK